MYVSTYENYVFVKYYNLNISIVFTTSRTLVDFDYIISKTVLQKWLNGHKQVLPSLQLFSESFPFL